MPQTVAALEQKGPDNLKENGPKYQKFTLGDPCCFYWTGNSLGQDFTFAHLERSCTRENRSPGEVFQQPCKFGGEGVGEPNAQGQLLSQHPLPAFINCSHRQAFWTTLVQNTNPGALGCLCHFWEWTSSYCINSKKKKTGWRTEN